MAHTPAETLRLVGRLLRNVAKLPRRAARSIARRLQPAYRFQRLADRYAKRELPRALLAEMAGVPGTTSDRECRVLFYLAAAAPGGGAIVEIGAFKGKSTAWLAQAARRAGSRVVSIEPFLRSSEEDVRSVLRRLGLEDVVTLHKAFSHEVGRDWSEPISMLWVDGGHDYEVVRQDVEDFAPHLLPGGMAVFDDMKPRFPGVAQALEETLMRDERFTYLGELRGLAVFRRR